MKRRKGEIRLQCVLVSEPPSIEVAQIDCAPPLFACIHASINRSSELP
jgi:hypothetical protein